MTRGRRALRALAVLVVLLVGLILVAAVLSQTAWFRERLRRLAMRQAERALEGTLVIGSVEGNLYNGVTLRDVSVMQGNVPVVRVAQVQLEYSMGDVLGAGRTVRRIAIDSPVIEAVRTPAGWNVARLLKPRPPADPNKPRATFSLPEVRVTNARVAVREVGVPQTQAIPRRVDGLNFEGSVSSSPQELSVDVRRLTFRAGQPDLDLRSLAGRIVSVTAGWRFQALAVRTGESTLTADGTLSRSAPAAPWAFDLDVTGKPLSLPEIGRFFPAASFDLHPTMAVSVNGTLDALALDLDVTQSEAGRAKGVLELDATGPGRGISGRLAVGDLNLAPIVRSAAATGRISGDATFDLRFPSATAGFPVDGTANFTGARAGAYGYEATNVKVDATLDGRRIRLDGSANAYGARATTRGTIARPGQGQRDLTVDLAGRIAGLDLRRLPANLRVPVLATDIDGSYAVSGSLAALKAEATLGSSTIEGATVADGTTGRFARTPAGFTFGAAGTIAGLDVQRLGAALRVPAMTDARLAGEVNGSFEVTGEQRGRDGLRVEATGTVTDTTTFGGRLPQVAYGLTLDGNRVDVTAKGRVEDFELETLTGTAAATGVLRGDIDARVSLSDMRAVTLENIDVQATVALDQPTVLKVPFSTVTADVSLARGLATVQRLEGRGEGFTLTADGTVGLGTDDASDLRYRLVADSLVQPAKVADLPLTGAATTEGRVTGTRANFLVTGTASGDQISYQDRMTAGVVTAQYAVRLPDWDAARLDVEASIDAQQIQVSGQTLSAVNGTVGYSNRTVRFDVDGTDAVRTLEAKGTLRLEEAMQRLELEQAQVARNGVAWALAPGTVARVAITPRQLTVGTVDLVRGEQRIQFEGTVGIAADAESSLRVDATGVDIGDVLVLANQDVDADGILTASATLGGTRERPLADGQLSVAQGRVRKIDVQSLGGRITFDGTLALIDLELIKDAYARVTAKGVVPRTLLEGRSDEHVVPSAADRIDVAILSTPIDLALAEGVSEYVTKLAGQAQMDVRVTGSGRDPHVQGALFLTNGTFVVPLTGVTYKNLDAVLTFEEERLIISELGVETDNGDLLTLQGELGLSREQARTVNLRMKGTDFRVLDNRYGLLDLDTDMTISGTLLAPVIEGSISVSDGRLELDEILPEVADTAYATKAEYQGIPTERLRGAIVPDLLGPDEQPLRLEAGTNTFALGTPPPSTESDGDPAAATDGEAAEEPVSAFAGSALNIQVNIPDNLVLRGQSIEAARASIGDVNATLGGNFRVAKTASKPVVLLGAVNTVRGTYAYQGRRFDILRDGQILFRGSEEIDPRLDITAERVIQGVEARVRIQGTARKPELSLSSNPPLDDGDILALIVFNQPLNQLGTGQQNSLSERAGGIAAGFVVSPLAEALGSTLDLDQFEVETTDPNGRVNPAVVIGQQVTQDMFLRFRQQFGNQQVSQFLLEYRLANYLRLQGNIAEGEGLTAGNRSLTQRIEQYGVDLVFYFSF
jgi:hypothetical protein